MSPASQPQFPSGFPVRDVHRAVLAWYRRHGRTLPWRNNPNPYHVLISEIMLQQTQVARVLEKFPAWLAAFPTIDALAAAPKRSVLLAWSGMGYNRRALNLHAAAKLISKEHAGVVPDTVEVLHALPGIGKYTASAVACFGYRKRVPLVDINIRRVFSRLTAAQKYESDMLPEKTAWALAAELLPPRAYYDWNQALMDFGSAVCTATSPACTECPLSRHCQSAGHMAPAVKARSNGTAEVPRRIYRGRVVELLRSGGGHERKSFTAIGKHLRQDFGEEHHEWLADILRTLERDSMVHLFVRNKPVSIRKYPGNLTLIRAGLAE